MFTDTTPLILTFNEAPNISRTLEQLSWAKEVLLVDSFSTDSTLDMARAFPAVRVVQRKFDTFAQQCNFGLQQVVSPWVLSLDADYVLSPELVREMADLTPDIKIVGYSVRFKYCVGGRPLRSTLYPPRVVLYRRDHAHYVDEGHGHRVQLKGSVADLQSSIYHDDRKPLDRWLSDQNRYALIESRDLFATPLKHLNPQDRVRRLIVVAPAIVFLYTLLGRGLIRDGWRGWFYVCQRTIAELLLSLRLAERKWQRER